MAIPRLLSSWIYNKDVLKITRKRQFKKNQLDQSINHCINNINPSINWTISQSINQSDGRTSNQTVKFEYYLIVYGAIWAMKTGFWSASGLLLLHDDVGVDGFGHDFSFSRNAQLLPTKYAEHQFPLTSISSSSIKGPCRSLIYAFLHRFAFAALTRNWNKHNYSVAESTHFINTTITYEKLHQIDQLINQSIELSP